MKTKMLLLGVLAVLTLPMSAGIKIDTDKKLYSGGRWIETSTFKFAGIYRSCFYYARNSSGEETFYFEIVFHGTYIWEIKKGHKLSFTTPDGNLVHFTSTDTFVNDFDYNAPLICGKFEATREDMEKLKNGATKLSMRCETSDCRGIGCSVSNNINPKKVAKQITQYMDLIDAAIK